MDGPIPGSFDRSEVEAASQGAGIIPGDPMHSFVQAMFKILDRLDKQNRQNHDHLDRVVTEAKTIATGDARGLTPKAEADLVQRVAYTATTATKQAMSGLVSQIKLRTIAIITLSVVALCVTSATAGYFLHDNAPVFAGVRAGIDRCEDQTDGSRLCLVPIYERLPSKGGK